MLTQRWLRLGGFRLGNIKPGAGWWDGGLQPGALVAGVAFG